MKEKKYKWVVITESKGSIQWKSVAFCETRQIARDIKKHQKAVWKMCTGVEVSIRKVVVFKNDSALIGSYNYY